MEISINRGLSELKLLDNRIRKSIESRFIDIKVANQDRLWKTPTLVKDFEELVKSNLQSIHDLMERRKAIKSAISISNAMTKVMISNKEYTVAEAIERKSSIEYEKCLLDILRRDFRYALKEINDYNERLENKISDSIDAMISSDSKNKDLIEQANKFAEEQRKSKKLVMVDPIDIEKYISNLDKEIDEFLSEVDFVLSESNAKTLINIPD